MREARVRVRRRAPAAGGPVLAGPVDQMGRRGVRHALPPDIAVAGQRRVGEDRVLGAACGEIADPVVERGRTPEIGKEDREARDLEALFRIERATPVEIAERLVAEEPVRGQNRPAAVGQSIQLGAVNPQAGQRPLARLVFERNARRAGLELGRAEMRVRVPRAL